MTYTSRGTWHRIAALGVLVVAGFVVIAGVVKPVVLAYRDAYVEVGRLSREAARQQSLIERQGELKKAINAILLFVLKMAKN